MTELTWDEQRSVWWLVTADERERQMAPISDALFDAAALQPGERVLDIGVGSGPTTAQAMREVGPTGAVTGLDVSAAMIAAARQRVPEPQIEWLVADAASHPFEPASFDVVISRFGVMFFDDPVAAFANLRGATRPGGRLVMIVWSTLEAAGFFSIPYTVVTTTLQRLGVTYERFPSAGIMFSLGAPGVVQRVLQDAGWADVDARVDNRDLALEPDPVLAARATFSASRPVQVAMEGQPDDVRAEVERALIADFEHRRTDAGITFPAGLVVVTARNP